MPDAEGTYTFACNAVLRLVLYCMWVISMFDAQMTQASPTLTNPQRSPGCEYNKIKVVRNAAVIFLIIKILKSLRDCNK